MRLDSQGGGQRRERDSSRAVRASSTGMNGEKRRKERQMSRWRAREEKRKEEKRGGERRGVIERSDRALRLLGRRRWEAVTERVRGGEVPGQRITMGEVLR